MYIHMYYAQYRVYKDDHLTYGDQKFLIDRIRTHNASYPVYDVLSLTKMVFNRSGPCDRVQTLYVLVLCIRLYVHIIYIVQYILLLS